MPATIDINVGTFSPLATGTICNATINSVTDSSNKVRAITNGTTITGVTVRKGAPPINFTFGGNGTYLPIGIAFKNTSNNADGGAAEFGVTLTANGNNSRSLQITDNNSDTTPDTSTYNFYILIQRISDGQLMLIDPIITNLNEE